MSALHFTDGMLRPAGRGITTLTALTDSAVAEQPVTISCRVLRAGALLLGPSDGVAVASADTCTQHGTVQHRTAAMVDLSELGRLVVAVPGGLPAKNGQQSYPSDRPCKQRGGRSKTGLSTVKM